jgi:Tfp pilus assembly protein PilP
MEKNKIKLFFRFATTLLFSFFIISCGKSETIERYDFNGEYNRVSKMAVVAKTKKSTTVGLADILRRKNSYRYSPVGKRDPFRSYFGDMKALNKDRQIVSELQRFDISDLTITAIIWGVAEPRAVIMAPGKKTFIVRRGSFIGKNWGRISRILKNKIEIVETYKDPLGRKILNRVYLELPTSSLIEDKNKVLNE